jgi:protein ImuA
MMPFAVSSPGSRRRAERLEDLRRLLPRLEAGPRVAGALPFGIAALDAHLPDGGLALAGLHEIVPETENDLPAAFGFIAALLGGISREGAPVARPILIALPRELSAWGKPHGHGLQAFGLDPSRLILVETGDDRQLLWAAEETLRSGVPAAVAGATVAGIDLKTSQRLHLAARETGVPLLLLRPAWAMDTSAAATRWRIGAAAAARDRFGLVTGARWRVRLERCRNGRSGEWVLEYDHAAYRFSLPAALADPALSRGGDAQSGARAGRSR